MSLLSRFLNVFRLASLEREFDEELRFHLDKRIERHVGSGMSREGARAKAYREFGSVTHAMQGMQEARVMRGHLAVAVVAGLSLCIGTGGVLLLRHSEPPQTGLDVQVADAGALASPSAQERMPALTDVEVTPPTVVRSQKSNDTPHRAEAKVITARIAQPVAFIAPGRDDQIPAPEDEGLITTRVEVEGVSMRVRAGGLARRDPPQPVVIFESYLGAPLEMWNYVLPRVAKFAPVVAYDRAGLGLSESDSMPPTPEHVVARLRLLLGKMHVAPPYVLVGAGWGGALIRYFAAEWPTEISGVVYVDPADLTQTRAEETALFESIGAGSGAREAFYEEMDRAAESGPPGFGAEMSVLMTIMTEDSPARGLPPAPDFVPATVIVANQPPTRSRADKEREQQLPFDPLKAWEAAQQIRLLRLPGWVRAPGEFLIAGKSFSVPWNQPGLISEAIRHLGFPTE